MMIPATFMVRVRTGAVVANAAPVCCSEVNQQLAEHGKPNAHPEAPACRAGAEGEREIDAQDAAPSDI